MDLTFNKKGFTLIESIVIAAVVGTILAFSGTMIVSIIRDNRRDQFVSNVLSVRDNFVELLKDPDAWKATVDAYGGTVPAVSTLFSPRTANGNQYLNYNVESASQGLTVDGAPCNGFVTPPGVGDPNCPIRLEFRWNQVAGSCAGAPGACLPNVAITVTALSNGGDAPRWVAIRPDRIDLPPIIRSGETLTMTNSACNSAAGEVVVGFKSTGEPNCRKAFDVEQKALELSP